MAVNQSPMYLDAEKRYRAASSPEDKLVALEEMLRRVPKHKGSEKLQAQIKQKIKAARKELQQSSGSKAAPHRDPFSVPKQGAGAVVLLGAANVGKSSIVGALTQAHTEVAEYPFSTHAAVPGMAHHQDVPIQLVDMPPLIDGHAQPGMTGAYRNADVILLVVDLSAIDLLDQFEQPISFLKQRQMRAVSRLPVDLEENEEEPVLPKRTLVAANKCDLPGALDDFAGLEELCGGELRMRAVSALSREGLPEMVAALFDLLDVIRIYPKKPGRPVDRAQPFILPAGGTVMDLALLVHRQLAEKLKIARVWGSDVHDGQQVHHTHVLHDKDVVELHF